MLGVEYAERGACKYLTDNFGLRNFGRYQSKTLLEMYRNHRDNPSATYVGIIQAAADYNGADIRPEMWENLRKQLESKGFGMKIFECNSDKDAYKAGLHAKWHSKIYGSSLAGALISGHGQPRSIGMGDNFSNRFPVKDSIDSWTVEDKDIYLRSIGAIFQRGAQLGLISCSAGKETAKRHSVAYHLARALGVTALAPTKPVAIKDIRALRVGAESVKFDVDYRIVTKVRTIHNAVKWQKSRVLPGVLFDGKRIQKADPILHSLDLTEDEEPSSASVFSVKYIERRADEILGDGELPTDPTELGKLVVRLSNIHEGLYEEN